MQEKERMQEQIQSKKKPNGRAGGKYVKTKKFS